MLKSLPGFCAKFADQIVRLHVRHLETKSYCRDYMVEEPKDLDIPDVVVTSEDVVREWKFLLSRPGYEKDFVNRLPGYYFEIFALHRKVAEALLPYGIVALHGSCVAVDQEAYLFTAESGVGKSAHSRLWCREFGSRAQMINDDKPFLRLMSDGTVRAYGSPWNGKHHSGSNSFALLRSISVLHRSETPSVTALPREEIFARLYEQTFHPQSPSLDEMLRSLLEKLILRVGYFSVGFNLKPGTAQIIRQGILTGLELQ